MSKSSFWRNDKQALYGVKASVALAILVAFVCCNQVALAATAYNRAAAVAYANAYAYKVVSDGYFWINSGTSVLEGAGMPVPSGDGVASGVGDDCAHFVSSCMGSEPHQAGGGLPIANALSWGGYGNPSASGLVSYLTSTTKWGTKVSSVTGLSAGDMIAYDWTGNGSIDHVVFYLGNKMIAAHASSHLNVAYNWSASSYPDEVMTYVHITVPDAVVPEPATLSCLAGGLLLATRRSRRRI